MKRKMSASADEAMRQLTGNIAKTMAGANLRDRFCTLDGLLPMKAARQLSSVYSN
jgi:hypothetical protein